MVSLKSFFVLNLVLFLMALRKACKLLMLCIFFIGSSSFDAGEALGFVKQSTFVCCIHKS